MSLTTSLMIALTANALIGVHGAGIDQGGLFPAEYATIGWDRDVAPPTIILVRRRLCATCVLVLIPRKWSALPWIRYGD